MMNKGDVVIVADDDEVRTRVTELSDSDTVYRGIVHQDSVFIALSTYQPSENVGGGEWMVNMTLGAVPAWLSSST